VRLYVDTSIFVDYLGRRATGGLHLRSGDRRGRSPEVLAHAAEQVLGAAARGGHEVFTSALTLYEAERTLHAQLHAKLAVGEPYRNKFLFSEARAFAMQVLLTLHIFDVEVVPLTHEIITSVVESLALRQQSLGTGDAIHLATALAVRADIVLSGDADICSADSHLTVGGKPLRCVDTDAALALLAG
jgi:predicted nucleic acid-binding protein